MSVTDTARTMFNWAVREEISDRNPFANLRRDRSRGRSDIQVLEEAELLILANMAVTKWGAYGIVVRAMIVVAAYTGVRLAELFGLRWMDVDLQNGVIHVRWQFAAMSEPMIKQRLAEHRARGDACIVVEGGLLWRPKNTMPRTIVLLPEATLVISEVPRRIGSDFVFHAPCGALFSKSKHHYYWDPVRTAFMESLPPDHWLAERVMSLGPKGDYDFHELRHFHASTLKDAGVTDGDNALQLGHTDGGELVSKRYAHPDKELARERIREQWAHRRRRPSSPRRSAEVDSTDGR